MSAAPPDPRARYFAIVGIRLLGSFGAVLGVVLLAKAHSTGPKVLGVAIVLSAMYFAATVPAALAHRWRSRQP